MKFPMMISWNDGWVEVEAELLSDIAPHLANVATFALHKGYGPDSYWWMVTSVEVGRKVSYSQSKEAAVRIAKDRLSKKSVHDVVANYRRAFREHGGLRAESTPATCRSVLRCS